MKIFVAVLAITFLTGCQSEEISSDCAEKPRSNAVCTAQYDPVCGCNNKTYSNACEAEAVGIKTYSKGECKK